MKILIFNWRDTLNPAGGGAEVYLKEIAKRWVQEGYEVTLFCARFAGSLPEEQIDGIKIVRQGNRFTVYWKAYRYYKKIGPGYYDCVIDSINTLPFFTPWFVKDRRIVLIYQLAREVWFYEAPFPFSLFGYLLEPIYLRFYRKENCITISESTYQDLLKLGFRKDMLIVNPGISIAPLEKIPEKESCPTLIYVGRLKRSKRVHHVLKAFSIVKQTLPKAQLWIVGEGDERYKRRLNKIIQKENIQDITFWGYVDESKKYELMRRAHLILVASAREGWGIIVIEAAAMGTPAVVYNVPGLRDSAKACGSGIVVTQNQPENLAEESIQLLKDNPRWSELVQKALREAKNFSWSRADKSFVSLA